MAPPPPRSPSLAVIAGRYPLLSETFVYREIRALRARGWRVRPVTLHAPAAGERPGVADRAVVTLYGRAGRRHVLAALGELARRPTRSLGTLGTAVLDAIAPGEPTSLRHRGVLLAQAVAALALAAPLRRMRIGHVHCHFAHAPATVGMYAARQLGIPFSFVGHANDLFERRALLKRKLRRAAFVACISHWHREHYGRIHGPAVGRCRLIRCGVELDGQAEPADDARAWRGRIVTVARLVPKKGIDTLIRALARLRAGQGEAWRLSIIGDGPQRDALARLVDELGCRDAVAFRGAQPNAVVCRSLREADVFALPCRVDAGRDRDGIPVVLMEAMAAGLPVVAGRLPTITELVKHETTGLLVDGDDPAAVAAALARLAREPELRRRLAEAGRAHVAEEFSLWRNVERLEAALRQAQVVGSRGRSGGEFGGAG